MSNLLGLTTGNERMNIVQLLEPLARTWLALDIEDAPSHFVLYQQPYNGVCVTVGHLRDAYAAFMLLSPGAGVYKTHQDNETVQRFRAMFSQPDESEFTNTLHEFASALIKKVGHGPVISVALEPIAGELHEISGWASDIEVQKNDE